MSNPATAPESTTESVTGTIDGTVPVIAIIGTGMIGRSWAIAFARGGCRVALHDRQPGAAAQALVDIAEQLAELEALALLNGASADQVAGRLCVADSLPDALRDCVHVQENAPETVELKRALFTELLEHAPAGASLASSSSALLASRFVPAGPGAARCLIAHPLNPPHLVPAVELVPGPDTDPEVVAGLARLMESIGQRPIVLSHEIEGFVMNRLQGALLDEAMRLIDAGTVSAEGIDRAVRDGLGLRWSFMGPIETIDLNAPGGITDFMARYGDAYRSIAATRDARVEWDADFAERLEHERRHSLPADRLAARRDWRDRQLMALAVHKNHRNDTEN